VEEEKKEEKAKVLGTLNLDDNAREKKLLLLRLSKKSVRNRGRRGKKTSEIHRSDYRDKMKGNKNGVRKRKREGRHMI